MHALTSRIASFAVLGGVLAIHPGIAKAQDASAPSAKPAAPAKPPAPATPPPATTPATPSTPPTTTTAKPAVTTTPGTTTSTTTATTTTATTTTGTTPTTTAADSATAAAEAEVKAAKEKLKTQTEVANSLVQRVWVLRGNKGISEGRATQLEAQLNSWLKLLKAMEGRLSTAVTQQERDAFEKELTAASEALAAISTELTSIEKATGWSLVETLLEARCATAICFENGGTKYWLGIEPLVELPVGKSFAIGNTTLSDWVNNHEIRVDLAAGLRVWFFRDVVSFSVYLSKALNDSPVRLEGSPFVYPGASIRRPYPGAAFGLLFDSLWVGIDRDELRNGDGQAPASGATGSLNPGFPPNEVISSAWTVTIALQPVTAFRTAIGTAVQSMKSRSK